MPTEVTSILDELRQGRQDAAVKLLPLVYAELRRLAASRLARLGPGQTLQPTALVHEAYLKLVGNVDPGWDGRGYFFATAANAMREMIVDGVRRKAATKHGGGKVRDDLDAAEVVPAASDAALEDVLAVHAALQELEVAHPRKAQIVVMRYFGGLSEEEIAISLDITARTVERDWRFARAWLHGVLFGSPA